MKQDARSVYFMCIFLARNIMHTGNAIVLVCILEDQKSVLLYEKHTQSTVYNYEKHRKEPCKIQKRTRKTRV